jgi:hypothetical protein
MINQPETTKPVINEISSFVSTKQGMLQSASINMFDDFD